VNFRDRLPRDLEGELRRSRPRAPGPFVGVLAERLRTERTAESFRRRLALAGAVATLGLLSLGAAAGLGFAGWRAQQAIGTGRGDERIPHAAVPSTSPNDAERGRAPHARRGGVDPKPVVGIQLQTGSGGAESSGTSNRAPHRSESHCRRGEKPEGCESKVKADHDPETEAPAEDAEKAKDRHSHERQETAEATNE
jgi:hypothetical protein